ncbi:MAG: PAS domain S-box protein [Candidatus Lokiarchaeota archaeon]|nr:PAS domain S-box protein [Candidatus Lokiarchaeota archaeon]
MQANDFTKLMEISKDILEDISDWIWETDKFGRFTYHSEGFKEFMGLEKIQASDLNLFDLFPDVQSQNLSRLTEFKLPLKSKNKGVFEVLLKVKPFIDKHRFLQGFRGTIKILDFLNARSFSIEKIIHLFIEKFDDIILVLDDKYNIQKLIRLNEKCNSNLSEELIKNRSLFEFIGSKDINAVNDFLNDLKKSSMISKEIQFIQEKKKSLWFDTRGMLYEDEQGSLKYILLLRNITRNKDKEKLLEQSLENYRSFTEKASELAFTMNLNLEYMFIAPSVIQVLGYTPEEIKRKKFEEFMSPSSIKKMRNAFREELAYETKLDRIINRVIFIELEFIHKKGSMVLIELLVSFLRDQKNKPQGIAGYLRKITQYNEIERKLIESEERYRTLFETSPNAIVIYNMKGEMVGFNATAEKLSGFKANELIGSTLTEHDLFPKKYLPIIMEDFMDLIKGKSVKVKEIQLHKKDMTPNWVLYQCAFFTLGGEKMVQVIIQDINELKTVEGKLKKSEKLYRNLFDNSPFGIWIVDSNGYIVDCNEGFNRYISNIPKNKVIGSSFVETLSKIKGSEYKHPPIEQLKSNFEKHDCLEPVEFKAMGIENKTIWITVETTIIRIGKEIFFQIILRDISEAKMLEIKLQEFNKELENQIQERTKELSTSKEQLIIKNEEQTLLLDNIETQIWYLENEHAYGAVNKAHANFLGIEKELCENKSLKSILSKKNLNQFLASNKEVFRKKIQIRTEEYITNKMGAQRLFSITKTPKLNKHGEVEYVVCAAEDITERNKAEAKLKESESLFRTITEQSLMGIAILQDGRVKYANSAVSDISGYTIDEILSWKKFELKKAFYPDDFLFLTSNIVELTRLHNLAKLPIEYPSQISFRILTKSGKPRWIDAYATTIRFREKYALLTTMIDNTEKKEFEENLIDSERKLREQNIELKKLDKLKTDFITIASHELKTPLISIIGFVDLILTRDKDLHLEIKEDLERVLNNSKRLEKYIEQLMDVLIIDAKKIELNLKEKKIKNIIKDCVSELDYQIRQKNLEIDIDMSENLSFEIDEFRITQVFLNLISNAIKFSKMRGKIRIFAEDQGEKILCMVQDSGLGLRKKEIDQLFRKFVTIDQNIETFSILERGSGLGLYITKGIVEAHGGKIWVKSQGKNLGSEFCFTIPRKK